MANRVIYAMTVARCYAHVECATAEAAASNDPPLGFCIAHPAKVRLRLGHCVGGIRTLPFVQAELPNVSGEIKQAVGIRRVAARARAHNSVMLGVNEVRRRQRFPGVTGSYLIAL